MAASLPKKTHHEPYVEAAMLPAREVKRLRQELVAFSRGMLIHRALFLGEIEQEKKFRGEMTLMTLKHIFWNFYLLYIGAAGTTTSWAGTTYRVLPNTAPDDGLDGNIAICVDDSANEIDWAISPETLTLFSEWLDRQGWTFVRFVDETTRVRDHEVMVVCMKEEEKEEVDE